MDQCFAAVLDLVREGVAVLLVEQNTQRALEHADSVVVLVSGHTVYRADGEEARRDARLVDSYLGAAGSGRAAGCEWVTLVAASRSIPACVGSTSCTTEAAG